MAWLQRGNSRCYVRSVRHGRRVLQEYFGNGPEAQLAALIDQERQRQRQLQRQARLAAQETWRVASEPMNELVQLSDLLLRATLLVNGYYQHHGAEWRPRRGYRRAA
jgi:hypothetical protein